MTGKSQLQIGEIVAVLVVFFMMSLIGFVVYFSIIRGEVQDLTENAKSLGSVGVVKIALSLPELQCSENNVVRESCFDKAKIELAKEDPAPVKAYPNGNLIFKEPSNYYFDLFGFSTIQVKQVYPDPNPPDAVWTIYDNNIYGTPPTAQGSGFQSNIPIIIFDPGTRENYFGVLTVISYSR